MSERYQWTHVQDGKPVRQYETTGSITDMEIHLTDDLVLHIKRVFDEEDIPDSAQPMRNPERSPPTRSASTAIVEMPSVTESATTAIQYRTNPPAVLREPLNQGYARCYSFAPVKNLDHIPDPSESHQCREPLGHGGPHVCQLDDIEWADESPTPN